MQEHLLFNTSRNICFGYLLETPHRGDSNKYPKQKVYEDLRIKHGICCIAFCSYILYNSKFIIMVISFGTNAVVVTRVHCSWSSETVTSTCGTNVILTSHVSFSTCKFTDFHSFRGVFRGGGGGWVRRFDWTSFWLKISFSWELFDKPDKFGILYLS